MNIQSFMPAFDKGDLYSALGVGFLVFILLRFQKIPTWDFAHLWQNLDKFILLLLFLVTIGFALHVSHDKGDASMMSWIQNTAGQILSALLAVLGARVLTAKTTNKSTNGNGDGNTPSTSEVTTTNTPTTNIGGI